MPLHLLEFKCCNGHLIIAGLFPPGKREATEGRMRALIESGLPPLGINPWCGICGTTKLAFEETETPFEDLGEALAFYGGRELGVAIKETGKWKGRN
jgi:hypothetical protein